MTKTLVVGLDGASWELLDPWIEAGELPNLAALRDTGTWAGTRSCLPPVTFPNWKCYSSGKDPGGFGVFWFENVDLDAGEINVMNGGDYDTAELWDYLNDEGQSAGVVNMPTMYPPRDIDDLVVAGGPDAVEGEYRSISSGYTSPPELAEELESRFDYSVHPDPLLSSNDERGAEVEAILDLLEKRFEVATTLMDEQDLDFVHVTLFYLNVLHHFFWDDEPSLRAWQLVDEWVGRLDDREDLNLVLMSDHGCDATQTEFYINEWLAENGYQVRDTSVDAVLTRIGLDRENLLAVAKRAGLVDTLARVVPESIQQLVPQRDGVKRDRKLEAIDLEQTKVVASGQGPVYINPRFDVESVRESLMADLREVEDEHGPLFTDVYRGEDVYNGPYVDAGPDVVVDQRPGVHVNDGIGGGTIQSGPDRWAAENTPYGIFAASGPDFEPQGELDRISILDIAPTVLAAHGCAVPTDMRGKVLPVFPDDPDVGERDPLSIDDALGSDDDDAVEDRLKQLGYME
ncbi:alkaline phosphatase family protein [Haloarcula sp. AONF1]